MSETVSKSFSDDAFFSYFIFYWAKLKQTWNIKMHKIWYIVESRYVKLGFLEILVKSKFVLNLVLSLIFAT
jgi:hypothetical protein